MKLTTIVTVLAGLAACDSNSSTDPDSGLGPKQITFDFPVSPPALLSVREGSGAWQALQAPYQVTLNGDVELVVVCAEATGFWTYVTHANAGELSAKQAYYCGTAPPPTRVAVTGQMLQAGTVAMQSMQSNTSAPWSFTLQVTPGMHDLVAYDSSRVLVRRNQSIGAATSIGTVDLTGAASLARASAVVPGQLPGEQLVAFTTWKTPNDSVTFEDTSNSLYAPPASLLAGDVLTAEAFVHTTNGTMTTSRVESHAFTGTETSFALPPALSVSFAPAGAAPSASWSELPPLDWFGFGVYGATNGLNIGASTSWVSAHGATSLAFDEEPPGYQASWRAVLAGTYTYSFYASSKNASSSVQQTFSGS